MDPNMTMCYTTGVAFAQPNEAILENLTTG